jgi:hypothetical protein
VTAILHVGPDHPAQLFVVLPVMVTLLLGLLAFVFRDRISRLFGVDDAVEE